jgi:hypothetical protein
VQKSVTWLVAGSLFLIYATLGIISALLIPKLPGNVSLLLLNETFGYSDVHSVSWFLKGLKWLVVLFPVIDICTNSPIIGQSLAGTLISWHMGTDHVHAREKRPFLFIFFRVISVVPSLIFAWWSTQLVRET